MVDADVLGGLAALATAGLGFVAGRRLRSGQIDSMFRRQPATADSRPVHDLIGTVLEPMVLRELLHRGVISERRGYDAKLIGWVEVV
jgi:hypothetical protein